MRWQIGALWLALAGSGCVRAGFDVLGAGADRSVGDSRSSDRRLVAEGTQDSSASIPGSWVTIPAGSFLMGSPAGEACREGAVIKETQHQVTLTHAFELQTTEVTQGQFEGVMGYNRSRFGPNGGGPSCGSSCPVDSVSWHEMAAYCNALSTSVGLARCYECTGSGASVSCNETAAYGGAAVYSCPGYRLPTEAEWEYAYRAGTTTPYPSGTNDPGLCSSCSAKDATLELIGWTCGSSGGSTHPVAQKQANAWGLFDLAGNIREWCHDFFATDLGSAAVTDPFGANDGISRVARGGSWNTPAQDARAAARMSVPPAYFADYFGARCARTR